MGIVLHVGMHKTGTTTIQKFCWQNRELLKCKGILYPSYELIGKTGSNTHHHIAHSIAGDTVFLSKKDVINFYEKINMLSKNYNKIFISAEPFCRHIIKSPDQEYKTFWQGHDRYVSSVAKIFGNDAEIIFVLRRQDKFASSLYQENIKKSNTMSMFFLEFQEKFAHQFEYSKIIDIWNKHFLRIKVFVFEDMVLDNGLIKNFFRKLNIDVSGLNLPSKMNETLPYDLIEFKRIMNCLKLPNKEYDRLVKKLLEKSEWEKMGLKKKFFWVDPDKRKSFLESFHESNQYVLKTYTDLSRQNLFPYEKIPILSYYKGLSPELFSKLFTHYLNVQVSY